MQRSVEQRQVPKRRISERRHPREQVLGFTPRQWPFIYVLVGNWVAAAIFYTLAKLYWRWTPESWTVGERIELVIKIAVFALMPALLAICIVAAQRLDPSMWVGRAPKTNSALDINTRFILNTFEQSILFVIGLAGLAVYCPIEEARTLIILAVLFLTGRLLFWVGYHHNPYVRAFGFGLTFYPTVMVYVWLFFKMVFDVRII
ncbi:MAG: MAPEG family protein [Methyloceanibacter sp.]